MGASPRSNTIEKSAIGRLSNSSIFSSLYKWINPDLHVANSDEVVNEFIDSLEEFRNEQNITDFVLCGHSLGIMLNYMLIFFIIYKSYSLIN